MIFRPVIYIEHHKNTFPMHPFGVKLCSFPLSDATLNQAKRRIDAVSTTDVYTYVYLQICINT